MKMNMIPSNFKSTIILTLSCILGSCSTESTRKEVEDIKESLWTESQKEDFVHKYAESDFDKFVLVELIAQAEYKKTDSVLGEFLKTDKFEYFKISMAKRFTVTVDDIAAKTKPEVERVLGKPNNSQNVNPSGAPCPCEKLGYLNDIVEVVFINGKADWITINNGMQYARINNHSNYVSMDRFSDYTYVKVTTD